jgi:hypothetical protein
VVTSKTWDALPATSVETSPDTILISGGLVMAQPCYSFRAVAAIRRDTIAVDLIGTRWDQPCQDVLTGFLYNITVTELPTGRFVIRLIYDRRGEVPYRETALQQVVEVP